VLAGLAGAGLYGGKIEDQVKTPHGSALSWSFAVDVAGLGLLLIAAVLIVIFDRDVSGSSSGVVLQQPVNPALVYGLPFTSVTTSYSIDGGMTFVDGCPPLYGKGGTELYGVKGDHVFSVETTKGPVPA
jgi:hypothetical protein